MKTVAVKITTQTSWADFDAAEVTARHKGGQASESPSRSEDTKAQATMSECITSDARAATA
jgi:hypothetical protein